MSEVVLSIQDISIVYHAERGDVRASNHISFDLHKGEAVALIGESGSGKTTVSLSFVDMLPPIAEITSGKVLFTDENGKTENILNYNSEQMRDFRWKECAMVFQGSQSSFNPVLRIRDQFLDTARAHGWNNRNEVLDKAKQLLRYVRLDPERTLDSFPHELSGGMKQRTLIALGVLLSPPVVIFDEPTTALDIITQRAIIDVLKEMQHELGFSIIFISHDLALAAELSTRVATMYAGAIVEMGPVEDIFYKPLHPYTLGLLQSVPRLSQVNEELSSIKGNPPDLINPPSGCKFHPRCDFASEKCSQEEPVLAQYEKDHEVACWHTDKVIEARKGLWD